MVAGVARVTLVRNGVPAVPGSEERGMSTEDRAVASPHWFEDYLEGSVWSFGRIVVDRDEVLRYAQRYDPQPFHVDEQAASQSIYGGLIASGWHTSAMMMREVAGHYLHGDSSLGSPGIDELRWVRPVRPRDVLTVRATVLQATRSRSRPDRGLVRSLFETLNDQGETVMSMQAMTLIRCRQTPAAGLPSAPSTAASSPPSAF